MAALRNFVRERDEWMRRQAGQGWDPAAPLHMTAAPPADGRAHALEHVLCDHCRAADADGWLDDVSRDVAPAPACIGCADRIIEDWLT